jgi:hypothetical protein
MNNISKLLKNILQNDEYWKIKVEKEKFDKNEKQAYNYIITMPTELLLRNYLLNEKKELNEFLKLIKLLRYLKNDKNKIPLKFDILPYDYFKAIKNELTDESIKFYIKKFHKQLINEKSNISNILNNNEIQTLINYLIDENKISDLINLSIYINIPNIEQIVYIKDKNKIFELINKSKNKYELLKKLNKPDFILQNLNNNLDINDETLKYFFDIIQYNEETYKFFINRFGFEKIFNVSYYRVPLKNWLNHINNINDLKIILNNLEKFNINQVEEFLKEFNDKFPQLYSIFFEELKRKKKILNIFS